ncbi:MAG: RagB/SusD family nutrient uptake outer membrane protein [Tannerella sp.]|jgi:hypothetical protein|nr:RagB/SusD family nutrient uptake outer membrane protein [Tannerella sp.]
MRTKHFITAIAAALTVAFSSCSDFLDTQPENILSDDQIFGDAVLIQSALANFYGRVTWGENVADWGASAVIDDAAKSDGGPDQRSTFEDNIWRTYDYTLIRNFNQFLKGVRETKVLSEGDRSRLEGEVRFLRAWTYFNTCRGLGGMPIVQDEIFDYTPGMDITTLQIPRSTEAALYDYIISECQAVSNMLPAEKQANNARANRWTAKMLEARAAIYAASIANYNNKMVAPVTLPGGEVGIPADRASGYYQTALQAAQAVIANSPYTLQRSSANDYTSLAKNFFNLTSVKAANTEVIWVRDYKSPDALHGRTTANAPRSHSEDLDNSWLGGILNLVEQYELIDAATPGVKEKIVTREGDGYKFYSSASEPFESRDPRLWGTIIYPGAVFKGREVVLQAGQLIKDGGSWTTKSTAELDSHDDAGNLITAENGPKQSNEQFVNKTGFYVRKFLDETVGNGTRGHGSDVWSVRFRIAEAYMIAVEASFELGNNTQAVEYINQIRSRAGVKPLTSVSFENIVHEYRVEFAFEDHRYWDMKRWRLADQVWNGSNSDEFARHRRLWPYRVVAPGDPNDGKWVFIEDFLFMSPNARYFQPRNYYNFIDLGWINNNPKIVKNPYQ